MKHFTSALFFGFLILVGASLPAKGIPSGAAARVLSSCYEVVHSYNGSQETLYNDDLNTKACELKQLVDSISGGSSFDVVGHDYYPLLNYVTPSYNFTETHKWAYRQELDQRSSFILIAKNHDRNGDIDYQVNIVFPETGPFLNLSPAEMAAIATNVADRIEQTAVENGGKKDINNATAEIAGLQLMMDYALQISNGTLSLDNTWQAAGFEAMVIEDGESVQRNIGSIVEGEYIESGNEFYDYAGLEISSSGESELLTDVMEHGARETIGPDSVFGFVTKAVIITDDLNSAAQLRQAENAFTQTDKKMIIWLHHSGDTMRVKKGDNLSADEAKILLDYFFEEAMRRTYPERFDDLPLAIAGEEDIAKASTDPCNELSWEFGKNCLLPKVEEYEPGQQQLQLGMAVGLLDGLLGTLKMVYDMADGTFKRAKSKLSRWLAYTKELWEEVSENRCIISFYTKIGNDALDVAKQKIKSIVNNYEIIVSTLKNLSPEDIWLKFKQITISIGVKIADWFGSLLNGEARPGYDIGVILFEVILAVVSGGGTAAGKFAGRVGAKVLPKISGMLRKLKLNNGSDFVDDLFKTLKDAEKLNPDGSRANPDAWGKFLKCKIFGKGCFVEDTPVLVASSSSSYHLRQLALGGLVVASAPVAAVPIQEVQLLDYVVSHQSVNSEKTHLGESIAGQALFLEDTPQKVIGVDPYTSPQQRQRDLYPVDSLNWYAVTFIENHGSSTAQFALHQDWIEQKGYCENKVVELDLPEQGIAGAFTISSIEHIFPQKKPIDEDEMDDFGYQPVTGLISHVSNSVYDIAFLDGSKLGVTYQHPIYSLTDRDWRIAGELKVGEKVLAYTGEVEIASIALRKSVENVFNLEVGGVHNYLVGNNGLVVHNICWNEIDDFFELSLADKRKTIKDAYDAWYPQVFGRRSFLEGVMRRTKFKDWNHTFDLASNFKAIDFYRNVNGKNLVSSMKTTKLNDVQSWISQNSSHLTDLVLGKNNKNFSWNGNSIPADIVQLNLFTKKGLTASERISWKNAIEAHTNGKIQVVVEVIEESL